MPTSSTTTSSRYGPLIAEHGVQVRGSATDRPGDGRGMAGDLGRDGGTGPDDQARRRELPVVPGQGTALCEIFDGRTLAMRRSSSAADKGTRGAEAGMVSGIRSGGDRDEDSEPVGPGGFGRLCAPAACSPPTPWVRPRFRPTRRRPVRLEAPPEKIEPPPPEAVPRTLHRASDAAAEQGRDHAADGRRSGLVKPPPDDGTAKMPVIPPPENPAPK